MAHEDDSTDCVTWREIRPHLQSLQDQREEMKDLKEAQNNQAVALREIRALLFILIIVSSPGLANGLMALFKAGAH